MLCSTKNQNSVGATKSEAVSRQSLVAKTAVRPQVLAAKTISRFNHVLGELNLIDVIGAPGEQINELQHGSMKQADQTLAAIALNDLRR